jgi:hypothetical protein
LENSIKDFFSQNFEKKFTKDQEQWIEIVDTTPRQIVPATWMSKNQVVLMLQQVAAKNPNADQGIKSYP